MSECANIKSAEQRKMNVPLLDLKGQYRSIKAEIGDVLKKALIALYRFSGPVSTDSMS